MKKCAGLLILTATISLAATADAKWLLFGTSKDETGLEYLQINRIPADEAGERIKFFREMLGPDEMLELSGKVSAGKGAARSIRISIDDKATWKDLKLSGSGTFEYQFKPSTSVVRVMHLEAAYASGKVIKTEELRREIVLSDETAQAGVREILDVLFDAYGSGNLAAYMNRVSADFTGGKPILERAIKKDFSDLRDVKLLYAVNSIASGRDGRFFVSVTYNRTMTVNRDGSSKQDIGVTEFIFSSKDGQLVLYSMKQPLVFGLSDAERVATGVVAGRNDGNRPVPPD